MNSCPGRGGSAPSPSFKQHLVHRTAGCSYLSRCPRFEMSCLASHCQSVSQRVVFLNYVGFLLACRKFSVFLLVSIAAFCWRRRKKKGVRNFVIGIENRGMSSCEERNNTREDTNSLDLRSFKEMNPEPLPPLTASSILGSQTWESHRAQKLGDKPMEGAKRAQSLDIDNPLYDYTDNCNRY